MGFKLGKFGKHLAGCVAKVAQGFADSLDYVVEAPCTPALMTAVALYAGVLVVKHFKTRSDRKHQTRSPSPNEASSCSPSRSTLSASSLSSNITSPRSPRVKTTHAHSVAPFKLQNNVVSRPSVASSNGQLAVFAPASPAVVPAAPARFTPEMTFSTPEKGAEECLDYDEFDQADEMNKLRQNYRTSKALAEIGNRDPDTVSLASGTKEQVPLSLDQLTAKGVDIRQASAQLSQPHKLTGQENKMIQC
ncbi:hypothetical protein ABBQ32_012431 [Trebouxia sp. C0010 RCD-2024]